MGSASSTVVVVNVFQFELDKLAAVVEKRSIKTHLDAIYSYSDAAKAQEHVEGKRTRGKVVINVAEANSKASL
jgi:NADPH:quinone reductase-like Zn-dependent oxidoreductase